MIGGEGGRVPCLEPGVILRKLEACLAVPLIISLTWSIVS